MEGNLFRRIERQGLEWIHREENGLVAAHPSVYLALQISLSRGQHFKLVPTAPYKEWKARYSLPEGPHHRAVHVATTTERCLHFVWQ